jgi:xylulokinase
MYLGVDVGTSGVKAIILDDNGAVAAQATAPLPISRPHPLWSEQNPDDWWTATDVAVRRLPAELSRRVLAIGLAGQMHGATVLDASDSVIRPAILWNDGRCAEECSVLEARVPSLHAIAGNLAMPGFTAPKLIWLRRHEPDAFERIAKVLLPKDYVRLCLSGEYATDVSDAAGTLWLDVANRAWSNTVLEACELSKDHMPKVYEGPEVTGRLRPQIAADWGMETNTPIIAGGGDNAAGAVGVGVFGKGDAFLSLGTSGVLFAADPTYEPNAESGVHTFCHALPDTWHQMSVMLSAASCLEWASTLTGGTPVGDLVAAAENETQFGQSRALFLPYLSGERTPHNNPNAQGVLFGLSHDSGPAAITQAVLEGVALGFADGLDVLSSGSEIETVSVIGGGARSDYWGRILSAALKKPLIYRKNADVGPALGAARLAQMGANGLTKPAFEPPAIESEIQPNADDMTFMSEQLQRFRALYAQTKDLL